MQQSSALYDPIASATPEQKLRAIEHRLRIERIARRAIVASAPPAPEPTKVIEIDEPPVEDTRIEIRTCNGQIVIITDRQVAEARAVFELLDKNRPHPSIERIQRCVCKYFGVSRHDMLSQRRTAEVVMPRQLAMYLAKKMTLKSLPEIGRRFGKRDHTTALHAVRKIKALMERDDGIRNSILEIESHLLETVDAVD